MTNPPSKPLPAKAAQIAADARAALARRVGIAALPAWPSGQLVEIAPGERVAPAPLPEQMRILVLDLERLDNGTYRPVARKRGFRVKITREGLPALGIAPSYKTLRRLIAAGFVRGEQPAPGFIQMDLESYFEHERATADPEFWTRNNGANLKKMRMANEGTGLGCGADYARRRKKAAPAPDTARPAVTALETQQNAS